MKEIKLIFITFIAFSIFGIVSCNSSNKTNNDEATDSTQVVVSDNNQVSVDSVENVGTTELGTEYTAKYICPNHCKNSGSDKEGECSECGMELMENPNYRTE